MNRRQVFSGGAAAMLPAHAFAAAGK